MFICDTCLDRDYPTARNGALVPISQTTSFTSYGQCEVCDEEYSCYDIPTSFLASHRSPGKEYRVAKRRLDNGVSRAYELAFEFEDILGQINKALEDMEESLVASKQAKGI